jgi:hypothetical protein
VLPLQTPIIGTDGASIHALPLRKGQELWIGTTNINQSKAIWGEDADKWVPDRFLRALPESVARAGVPGVYSHT